MLSKHNKLKRQELEAMTVADLMELRQVCEKKKSLLDRERNSLISSMTLITNELRKRKAGNQLAITDHAIVRYLQRVEGFDIELRRQKIEAMVRRSVRINSEMLKDEETGLLIVQQEKTNSIATIIKED